MPKLSRKDRYKIKDLPNKPSKRSLESELREHLDGLSFDPFVLTDKIIEFGRALVGISIYDYQYEAIFRIIFSVVTVEGANITMLWSRQSGKTESVAFCIATLSVILPVLAKFIPELEQYKNGIKIGLFAPQNEQVNTTYSRAMLRIQSDNAELIMRDPEINTELLSSVRLRLTNGSFLQGQSAAKQAKIESKTYDLIIVEEAQDIDSYIVQKSIEPMSSSTNGTIIKVGTTGTSKNHYWQDIQINARMSRSIDDVRLKYHYEYDYKRVIADRRKQYDIDHKLFHLNYEKDVMKKLQKWGADSDAFRLSYALKWALDVGMFITDKDWNNLLNRRKGLAKKVEKDWFVVAGLDIAKSSASTVLTILRITEVLQFETPSKELLCWVEINGDDYETQHHAILRELIEWNVSTVYADYTGVGKPFVDRLMYACGEFVSIIPYTFSRPSKSDMWIALQNDIRNGKLKIPANRDTQSTPEFQNFKDQMNGLQKYYEGSYLVAEKDKDDINSKDDYCDSLGLAVLAGNQGIDEVEDVEDSDMNPFMESVVSTNHFIRAASW